MIARTTKALLGNKNILRFGFCLNKAHLDPYKHTTMNHYPHNMYVDLYDFGEYPEVVMPASISPRTYQPIVVATAVDVLNARYGSSLTVESFNEKLDRPWSRIIQKDLNSQDKVNIVLSPVINRLAINIFVRQSRWTWIKEQRERLNTTSVYFEKHKPETPRQFLETYNALIEKLVLASTFGMSPHIPQAPSTLEKHYVQEMADSIHEGVEELNNLKGEHDNTINRFIGLIHRL